MLTVVVFFASLVFTTVVNSHDDDHSWRHSEKVKGLLKNQYDHLINPNAGKGGPVNVNVTAYLSHVKWSENKLGVIFYLRHFWNDPRLAFQDPKSAADLTFNADEIIPYIWKPDTFFQEQLKVKTVNHGFLKVKNNGDVNWSQIIKLKTPCVLTPVMVFENDGLLNCTISLASYSFTTDDIKYHWNQPKAVIVDDFNRDVISVSTGEKQSATATGNFDSMLITLQLQTKFTREVMKFMAAKLIKKFEI